VEEVMAAQQPIAFAHSKALVGRELEVLVEGHAEDGTLRARTPWEAPEIDPHVVIRKGHAHEGELARVRVVRASGYDVVAELV
jgi:ribosomal protein S12 methylthiotransferase